MEVAGSRSSPCGARREGGQPQGAVFSVWWRESSGRPLTALPLCSRGLREGLQGEGTEAQVEKGPRPSRASPSRTDSEASSAAAGMAAISAPQLPPPQGKRKWSEAARENLQRGRVPTPTTPSPRGEKGPPPSWPCTSGNLPPREVRERQNLL